MFVQTLKKHQLLLRDFLINFLNEQEKKYSEQKWSKDVFNKLKSYATTGKFFRGSMFLATTELFTQTESPDKNWLPIATALELIHSSLLIQDDVMDQDELRRGNTTVHLHYQTIAQNHNFNQSKRFGESMAICTSDICQLLAFYLINQTSIISSQKAALIEAIVFDINQTVFAQMEDVEFAHNPSEFNQQEILKMLLYKSARYTFSLPMIAGGILAKVNKERLKLLSKLGESLGLIFQIRDDELGILGNSEEMGKPAGNDIRENKKTLWRYWTIKLTDPATTERLKILFGKKNLTAKEITFVRQVLINNGAKDKVDQQIDKLVNSFNQTLELLCLNELTSAKQFFTEALEFNLKRKK